MIIVAAGPPLLAIVFALGVLGWLGFQLNMFLNVMTPLIMVISFSDSMQLTFAARDRLMAGDDQRDGLPQRNACRRTRLRPHAHATAGLSLPGPSHLLDCDLIRAFGEAGFFATAIALVTVLSLVPVLGVLLSRDEARFAANLNTARTPASTRCAGFAAGSPAAWCFGPASTASSGSSSSRALAFDYLGLKPSYRLADEVPDQ